MSALAEIEGPVFDFSRVFVDPFRDEVEAEFAEEGVQSERFGVPEGVGSSAEVEVLPVLARCDVEEEAGAVLDTEDEGANEVHGSGGIELEDFHWFFLGGMGVYEGEEAGEEDDLRDLVEVMG